MIVGYTEDAFYDSITQKMHFFLLNNRYECISL